MTDLDPAGASTLLVIMREKFLKRGDGVEHTDFELELSEPMLRALADLIQYINNHTHLFRHEESLKEPQETEEVCAQKL